MIWHRIARYILGIVMACYGVIKIFPIQFALPSEVYSLSLGDIDGVTLTWAFFGHSKWFAAVLGVFELIPATLLFFDRTKLIGSILLFPTLSAIALINIAYGFLPHMILFTCILWIVNVALLYAGRTRLRNSFDMLLVRD